MRWTATQRATSDAAGVVVLREDGGDGGATLALVGSVDDGAGLGIRRSALVGVRTGAGRSRRPMRLVLGAWVLALAGLACGGATSSAPGDREPRAIVLDEVPLSGCPSVDAARAAHVEVPGDAERPEAVGLWIRACDPEAPGPHVPRAFEGLVYDGRYVTLVALDRSAHVPDPPLRALDVERPFRLAAAWEGDVLRVRVPPWLTWGPAGAGAGFVDLARFDPSRDAFFWPEDGEPAYVRSSHPLDVGPWSHLTEPHAPIEDYESDVDVLGHAVHAHLAALLAPCVEAPGAAGEGPLRALVVASVSADGRITALDVTSSPGPADAALRRCVHDAADRDPRIEGYAASAEAVVRLSFGVQ